METCVVIENGTLNEIEISTIVRNPLDWVGENRPDKNLSNCLKIPGFSYVEGREDFDETVKTAIYRVEVTIRHVKSVKDRFEERIDTFAFSIDQCDVFNKPADPDPEISGSPDLPTCWEVNLTGISAESYSVTQYIPDDQDRQLTHVFSISQKMEV